MKAMEGAVAGLAAAGHPADYVLVDGNRLPKASTASGACCHLPRP